MTRDQEILARAMNYIDDDLIVAAHAPRRKLRRLVPWLTAACLVIVLVAVYPTLRSVINVTMENEVAGDAMPPAADEFGGMNDNQNSADKPEQSDIHSLGTPVTLGGTTLTMTDVTETTATFTVVKTDNEPLYVAFYQYAGGIMGTTEPNYRDNGVIIRPYTVKLTVNRAETITYDIPTAAGTYEILVDFSSLRRGSYRMEEFIAFYAYIGKDGAAVTERLSLAVPATDVTETSSASESLTEDASEEATS